MPVIKDPAVWLRDIFIHAGLSYSVSSILSTVALVLIVILLSWLSNVAAKAIINNIVARIVRRTKTTWDDIFLENKVFTRLSHFAPAWVIWSMAAWALKDYDGWLLVVHRMTYIYMVIITMVVVNSFIDSWHDIYKTLPIARHRHIKGYVQLVKILVIVIAILVIISVVFKQDISTIVAGLGAMAAVLILVFKDTLLGLVASIQLSADKMLKVGDWISIPKRDVDGIVTDITLTTVKIQNFDKTIITVPTYSLVNDSFQNWRGMEEAGIRQLKRSFLIDAKSIKFIDVDLKAKLSIVPELKEYLDKKNASDENVFYNYSRITNLGIFRYYAETYLKKHPYVDAKQTVILRHRHNEGEGLHLQVYVFAKGTEFLTYEDLQSEIVEHLLSIMGEFGLKVFQQPTGEDLKSIMKN
jgi:miniconductance mechanosensitive channel